MNGKTKTIGTIALFPRNRFFGGRSSSSRDRPETSPDWLFGKRKRNVEKGRGIRGIRSFHDRRAAIRGTPDGRWRHLAGASLESRPAKVTLGRASSRVTSLCKSELGQCKSGRSATRAMTSSGRPSFGVEKREQN